MVKRLTDTEIWQKDWFLDLSIKKKLLVKFLFDNCDCAGVYEISYRTLKNCFNEEITKEDFEGIKQIKFIDENTIFIEDFIYHQYKCKISELNYKFTVHRGIIRKLNKYNILETLCKGFENPLISVQDKDKNKNNTINKHINTIDINYKLYGEYKNVFLTDEHYQKLTALCLSDKLLNQLINAFSIQIEVGKEKPYIADLPNAHYERIKSYYNYRKRNPNLFREERKEDVWEKIAEQMKDCKV